LPHEHHDELGDDEHSEEHAQADDLIDYLQLIFHTDLGDGHMETFESEKGFDFDAISKVDLFPDQITYSYYPLLLNPTIYRSRVSFYNYDVPIQKKDVILHLDLRGPPSFV
jgi:hypothetical protein